MKRECCMPRYAMRVPQKNLKYIGHTGSGFIDVVRNTANKLGMNIPEPMFEGERHAIGLSGEDKGKLYSWAGPGTRVEKRVENAKEGDFTSKSFSKALNPIDAQAKKHDISYYKTNQKFKKGEVTKEQAKKEIWKADKEFKSGVERNKEVDPTLAKIAQGAISLKEVGERIGVLPISKFSLSGDGKSSVNPNAEEEAERLKELFKPKPGMRLKAMVGKGMKGGIAPAAILIPVIASLAGSALGKLFDYFTEKKGKGMVGQGGISDEEKREHILREMAKLPKAKQLKIITSV